MSISIRRPAGYCGQRQWFSLILCTDHDIYLLRMKVFLLNGNGCNSRSLIINLVFYIMIVISHLYLWKGLINDKFINLPIIPFISCQIHTGKTKLIFSICLKFHITFPDTVCAMPSVIWMIICLTVCSRIVMPGANLCIWTGDIKTHIFRIKIFLRDIHCGSSFPFIVLFVFCFVVVIYNADLRSHCIDMDFRKILFCYGCCMTCIVSKV